MKCRDLENKGDISSWLGRIQLEVSTLIDTCNLGT